MSVPVTLDTATRLAKRAQHPGPLARRARFPQAACDAVDRARSQAARHCAHELARQPSPAQRLHDSEQDTYPGMKMYSESKEPNLIRWAADSNVHREVTDGLGRHEKDPANAKGEGQRRRRRASRRCYRRWTRWLDKGQQLDASRAIGRLAAGRAVGRILATHCSLILWRAPRNVLYIQGPLALFQVSLVFTGECFSG